MKLRRGPRPAAIAWFVVLFLAGAALGFADALLGLRDPGMTEAARDATIVGGSVRVTIAFMTAGLVWFYAMRIARWIVPGFLLVKIGATLVGVVQAGTVAFVSPLWLVATAVGVAAAAMLFAPSARPWFSREGASVDDVFG